MLTNTTCTPLLVWCTYTRTTEDFLADIMEGDASIKLEADHVTKPPSAPMLDYAKIQTKANKQRMGPPGHRHMNAIYVQLIATGAVCTFLVTVILACRCWRQRQLRFFLDGLPDQSDDQTWLVVAYDWADRRNGESGRIPLEGIVCALLCSLARYSHAALIISIKRTIPRHEPRKGALGYCTGATTSKAIGQAH